MTLRRVISGGQSGCDQAALRAALRAGLPTGGTAPRCFYAEATIWGLDGKPSHYIFRREPDLHSVYGLVECPDPAGDPPPEGTPEWREWITTIWKPRTIRNARDSDGTAWLGPVGSLGFYATERACKGLGRPFLVVPEGRTAGARLIDWIGEERVAVLNCAGSRESKCPGIGAKTEAFLVRVFGRIVASSRPK